MLKILFTLSILLVSPAIVHAAPPLKFSLVAQREYLQIYLSNVSSSELSVYNTFAFAEDKRAPIRFKIRNSAGKAFQFASTPHLRSRSAIDTVRLWPTQFLGLNLPLSEVISQYGLHAGDYILQATYEFPIYQKPEGEINFKQTSQIVAFHISK